MTTATARNRHVMAPLGKAVVTVWQCHATGAGGAHGKHTMISSEARRVVGLAGARERMGGVHIYNRTGPCPQEDSCASAAHSKLQERRRARCSKHNLDCVLLGEMNGSPHTIVVRYTCRPRQSKGQTIVTATRVDATCGWARWLGGGTQSHVPVVP